MKVLVQNEKGAASTFPAHRPIIIEHLLTHTSGLTYNFFGNAVSKIYAANGVDSDGGSVDTRGKFRVPDQGLHFYTPSTWNWWYTNVCNDTCIVAKCSHWLHQGQTIESNPI